MQRLRQARLLVRLVLAWFALAVGVAVAAPVVALSTVVESALPPFSPPQAASTSALAANAKALKRI